MVRIEFACIGNRWLRYTVYLSGVAAGYLFIQALTCLPALFVKSRIQQNGIELLCDQNLSADGAQIIEKVHDRVAKSELYHPDMKFRVYLCGCKWVYRATTSFSTGSTGAYAPTTNRISISISDIHSTEEMVAIIAHEITHAMVDRKLGWRDYFLPTWLSEGYAECVAKGPLTYLQAESLLRRINSGQIAHDDYRRYRMLASFCLNTMKIPVSQLFTSPPDVSDVLAAIRAQPVKEQLQYVVNGHI